VSIDENSKSMILHQMTVSFYKTTIPIKEKVVLALEARSSQSMFKLGASDFAGLHARGHQAGQTLKCLFRKL